MNRNSVVQTNNLTDQLKEEKVEYFEESKLCKKRLKELKKIMKMELEKARQSGIFSTENQNEDQEFENENFKKALEEVLEEKLREAEKIGESYFESVENSRVDQSDTTEKLFYIETEKTYIHSNKHQSDMYDYDQRKAKEIRRLQYEQMRQNNAFSKSSPNTKTKISGSVDEENEDVDFRTSKKALNFLLPKQMNRSQRIKKLLAFRRLIDLELLKYGFDINLLSSSQLQSRIIDRDSQSDQTEEIVMKVCSSSKQTEDIFEEEGFDVYIKVKGKYITFILFGVYGKQKESGANTLEVKQGDRVKIVRKLDEDEIAQNISPFSTIGIVQRANDQSCDFIIVSEDDLVYEIYINDEQSIPNSKDLNEKNGQNHVENAKASQNEKQIENQRKQRLEELNKHITELESQMEEAEIIIQSEESQKQLLRLETREEHRDYKPEPYRLESKRVSTVSDKVDINDSTNDARNDARNDVQTPLETNQKASHHATEGSIQESQREIKDIKITTKTPESDSKKVLENVQKLPRSQMIINGLSVKALKGKEIVRVINEHQQLNSEREDELITETHEFEQSENGDVNIVEKHMNLAQRKLEDVQSVGEKMEDNKTKALKRVDSHKVISKLVNNQCHSEHMDTPSSNQSHGDQSPRSPIDFGKISEFAIFQKSRLIKGKDVINCEVYDQKGKLLGPAEYVIISDNKEIWYLEGLMFEKETQLFSDTRLIVKGVDLAVVSNGVETLNPINSITIYNVDWENKPITSISYGSEGNVVYFIDQKPSPKISKTLEGGKGQILFKNGQFLPNCYVSQNSTNPDKNLMVVSDTDSNLKYCLKFIKDSNFDEIQEYKQTITGLHYEEFEDLEVEQDIQDFIVIKQERTDEILLVEREQRQIVVNEQDETRIQNILENNHKNSSENDVQKAQTFIKSKTINENGGGQDIIYYSQILNTDSTPLNIPTRNQVEIEAYRTRPTKIYHTSNTQADKIQEKQIHGNYHSQLNYRGEPELIAENQNDYQEETLVNIEANAERKPDKFYKKSITSKKEESNLEKECIYHSQTHDLHTSIKKTEKENKEKLKLTKNNESDKEKVEELIKIEVELETEGKDCEDSREDEGINNQKSQESAKKMKEFKRSMTNSNKQDKQNQLYLSQVLKIDSKDQKIKDIEEEIDENDMESIHFTKRVNMSEKEEENGSEEVYEDKKFETSIFDQMGKSMTKEELQRINQQMKAELKESIPFSDYTTVYQSFGVSQVNLINQSEISDVNKQNKQVDAKITLHQSDIVPSQRKSLKQKRDLIKSQIQADRKIHIIHEDKEGENMENSANNTNTEHNSVIETRRGTIASQLESLKKEKERMLHGSNRSHERTVEYVNGQRVYISYIDEGEQQSLQQRDVEMSEIFDQIGQEIVISESNSHTQNKTSFKNNEPEESRRLPVSRKQGSNAGGVLSPKKIIDGEPNSIKIKKTTESSKFTSKNTRIVSKSPTRFGRIEIQMENYDDQESFKFEGFGEVTMIDTEEPITAKDKSPKIYSKITYTDNIIQTPNSRYTPVESRSRTPLRTPIHKIEASISDLRKIERNAAVAIQKIFRQKKLEKSIKDSEVEFNKAWAIIGSDPILLGQFSSYFNVYLQIIQLLETRGE